MKAERKYVFFQALFVKSFHSVMTGYTIWTPKLCCTQATELLRIGYHAARETQSLINSSFRCVLLCNSLPLQTRAPSRLELPTMHIFLIGGSGRTGSLVIDEALSRGHLSIDLSLSVLTFLGHTITALVRDPTKLPSKAGLTTLKGRSRCMGSQDH